ncbi:MAG: aminotransferase class I/II-fold pyridoxal phosphate-dependent enzyme [Lentisphaeria bacterium]|nr:aminotransferase class I/II-fold pyridoxal phosphate-dependent enzyme [Lentisphaeria bacterium]
MKRHPNDLAIFGSPPAFSDKLFVGRPSLGDRARFLERLNDILDRRWLTNDGIYVREFEKQVAGIVGVRHCVAMCSGTTALQIAIRALDLTGEVIIPSFTFVADAHVLEWQRIRPVFCDIDPTTCNLDPQKVEEAITERTNAILAVHLWGRPCDTERLAEIAERRGVHLLFDASHAFGCTHNGRAIGGFGELEVFSFHATKMINTFEGGAVTTNDDDLAETMRSMRNFGFAGFDNVVRLGTNGKMNEVSAAMGITGLESLNHLVEHNRQNDRCYRDGLQGIPGIEVVSRGSTGQSNCQYIVIRVDPENGLPRDRLVEILCAENIIARRYFYPGCHRMEPYRTLYPEFEGKLPNSDWLAQRVVTLPTGEAVDSEQIKVISSVIRCAMTHGAEIEDQLSASS